MRISDEGRIIATHKRKPQSEVLTCDDAPFLPGCAIARTRGEQCQTGSFSVTLDSGALVVGKMWETRSTVYRNKFYRSIEVNGVLFTLRHGANGISDDLFEALGDGDVFNADVIQKGAKGRFNLSTAGGLCRSGYLAS